MTKRQEFIEVGASYCVQHHGLANEDDSVCDFALGEAFPCQFRQLGYVGRPRRRRSGDAGASSATSVEVGP